LTDELNDAQMAELFALLLQEPQEQQLPPSTAPLACQDLLPAVPPDVLEFSSAEDALDAKILQLLALKEAAVQQRQQRQQHELMLLQQQLAAVDPAATADTATKQQHQVSARGQALDVGPDLQLRLTT
jgi:hypothetical protein